MSTPSEPPLSRRAARQAELSTHDAQPEGFAQPATRRDRGGMPVSVPSSAPSDVAYRTEVRPRVPHYDEAPSSLGWVPEPLVEPPVAPSAPANVQVRRRDFRPPAEQQPEAGQFAPAGESFDTALEYHTQLTPRPDARPADPVTATSTAPPLLPHVITPPVQNPALLPTSAMNGSSLVHQSGLVEETLSRRELRAMRDQAVLPPESMPTAEREPTWVAPAPVLPAPTAPSAAPSTAPSAAPSTATGSHWSVGIHDDDDPFENTFSREVGSTASLSTNALVLPEMPPGGIGGPVAGTGEIIITGMIDLSRAVSSTGTMPTVHESPDIDDLFEPGDLAAAPADAAPVSALRAVSSHTGTQGVMASSGKRPSSNVITTVLVASTVVMAVVAIGLFVLAAMNGLF